jgi:predicted phage tail protein
MKRDEGTYGRIGKQYDEYSEVAAHKPVPAPRALPPQRPYAPEQEDAGMGRTVVAAIGIVIGAILVVLAIISFVAASKWSGLDRGGAAVGYAVVGFFLTLGGVGGMLATYNHNFRVLTRTGGNHH